MRFIITVIQQLFVTISTENIMNSVSSRCWFNISSCSSKSTCFSRMPEWEVGLRVDKKAVLSQRWPRDARYISSRCGDMAIRNIQDGGGSHLEFVRIEISAITPAVPENPTLEQNMKWIGRPVAEISPLEIFPTWRWPPSWICSNRE